MGIELGLNRRVKSGEECRCRLINCLFRIVCLGGDTFDGGRIYIDPALLCCF